MESSSVAAMLATDSPGPTSVAGINEIDQLITKVNKLAQKLQTTGERLSRISGLFPPGHGPCAELVQGATNRDVDALRNLELDIANIRDSFANFGKNQDKICRECEKEFVLIKRRMNQQDDDVASAVAQEVKEGEASEKHLCLPETNSGPVCQLTLESTSVAIMLGTNSEGPAYITDINEIDKIMSEVDTLAQKLQTTGERLSGLFPHGHGTCVEAIQEATNYDVNMLTCLKIAITDIQNFRKNQDEICMHFEGEAVLIEMQMNQQDGVVAFVAVEDAKVGEPSGAANYEQEAQYTEESNEAAKYISPPEPPPEDYYSDDEESEDEVANEDNFFEGS
ncbi:unnamed protein product [Alopecurus aequalis]